MNSMSFSGNCSIQNQSVQNFSASGNCYVDGLSCKDLFHSSGFSQIQSSKLNKVTTSGSTKIFQSTMNEIRSSGYLQASDCPRLGNVTTSGSTSLTRCKDIQEIVSSGAFHLAFSQVSGNVRSSGHRSEITDSAITGTFECAAKVVKVSNSTIGKIVIKPSKSNVSFFFMGWKIGSETNSEQIVELFGKNCRVDSISFEDGAVGKVVLRDGATMPKVSGLTL